MSKLPYTCLLILLISPSWYQMVWFGLLCSLVTALVMWCVYRRRLRKLEIAIRIAIELHDIVLQSIEACKFVADDALERLNDTAYMRLALENLSRWLGLATQQAQQALKSLSSSSVEKHDD